MILRILLCVLSAVLLIFSFPNFDLSIFAWIAFVPLFFAIRDRKASSAFLLGFITGLIFYLVSIYWLANVTWLGFILLSLYLALYLGVFVFFIRYTLSEIRYPLIIIPAIWVALEYLRATLFTGIGWSLLGYSQYKNLAIIQIADITGTYGISFLIIMVNFIVYESILRIIRKPKKYLTIYDARYTIYALVILSLALSYGYLKLGKESSGNPMKISIIQGNIPQERKWDITYESFIFDRYSILTRVASSDEPDLIIWPETAFPGYFESDEKLTKRIKKLADDVKTPILFGTVTIRPIKNKEGVINTAVLLDKRGEEIKRYDKLHLVPFGEYVPFEKWLGFVHELAPFPIAGFAPGNEYTVFNLSNRFSVLICFEDIFPGLVRRFVQEGALFLVNITNDAWFKKSAAPYQHAQASVFRAVENRVNVIRAANTGLSCFIDPKGRITARIENRKREDIFIEGYATQTIKIEDEKSLYTKYGDIFAYLCTALFVIAILKKRKLANL